MKKYNIKVNGKTYEVEVEEVYSTSGTPQPAAAAPAPSPAPAPAAAPTPAAAGNITIEAAVPGKVVKISAEAGQAVKKGDPVVVVESMKMEIPVVAPEDGTIAGINVSVGDSVETGDLLASMNA